ncbi:MAG: hypothetical protein IJM37_10625 [Lachnospiraceae bacterium]|nr:hypothetical protein [Lachnospiraceae bacterium]
MTKEDKREERLKAGKDFEEKYEDVLNTIKLMPKKTLEDKEARYSYIKSNKCYDSFVVDLFKAYSPKEYTKLTTYLSEQNKNVEYDSNIAFQKQKKNTIDTLVFMETFMETIKGYTGEDSKGRKVLFLQNFGIKYRQKADIASAENEMAKNGVSIDRPSKNKVKIMKLVKIIKKSKDINNKSVVDAIDEALKSDSVSVTKRDIEVAICIVESLDFTSSLSKPINEEGNVTQGDIISNEFDVYEQFDSYGDRTYGEVVSGFFNKFLDDFDTEWEQVKIASSKPNRNILQLFLTKDLLILLKLKSVNATNSKIDKFEKNLGSKYKNEEDRGIYYIRYKKEPAGNRDVYTMLQPSAIKLCNNIFNLDYVNRAISNLDNNLLEKDIFYSMYYNLLKKDFKFSDEIIAEILNKNKTIVSRARNKYEKFIEELYYLYFGSAT